MDSDCQLQRTSEAEEIFDLATICQDKSPTSSWRTVGSALALVGTSELRPRLHITIPDTIAYTHPTASSILTRPSPFLLTSSSQGRSPLRLLPAPITHTNSRTWSHPRMAEHERWIEVERDLKRMELIPRSPFVPHTFDEWLSFRSGRVEDEREEQERKIANRRASTVCIHSGIAPVKIRRAMGGRRFADGRSTVLCIPTMWSPWYSPTDIRPQALWPCPEEMKEEGDERNTSRFGRFLSLPRVPGNETVVWKQKKYLPPLPFDEVWRRPDALTFEDVRRVTEGDVMEKMVELLGRNLMQALDGRDNDGF
ncbi:MAG: hypothetical protein Q9217_004217 [Psora testacea]